MKKYLFLIVLLTSAIFYSQDLGRVGMNTTKPEVSLDIKEKPISILPVGTPQGISFTNFSTEERSTFKDVKIGTMIFNTTKKCLEIFLGIVNGVPVWNCIPDTSSQTNITIAPAGFTGSYIGGIPMTSANTTKFTLCNNSFTAISNVDFSGAITVVNGLNSMSIVAGQNNNVSLGSGACTTLSYTLTGTPISGTLTTKFNKLNLNAEQSTQVGYGSATITDKTQYVISLVYRGISVQGKINNGANKLTIPIPYINGSGSYDAVSMTQVTAAGQGGDTNNLTLSIPAGNFGVNGTLNADITVDGDGEYLVKQLSPVDEYTIATFAVNMHGTQYNVILKGTSGIPDKMFGIQTNSTFEHQFIYLPIQGPDGKTWLNNNLGADYTNANSPNFSYTGQQATSKTDYKAYGSLYQWQRPSDGHELFTWTSSTAGTPNYGSTTTLSNNTNWTAGHNMYIINDGGSWVNSSINQSGPYTLWQSGAANNPCPSGYHVPTHAEMQALHQAITGSAGTVSSSAMWNETVLRLPASGSRFRNSGSLNSPGYGGWYWTSDNNSSTSSWNLGFVSSNSLPDGTNSREQAYGIRCMKD